MTDNTWDLYESVEGWEAASVALDKALADAFSELKQDICFNGKTMKQCIGDMKKKMKTALADQSLYGADDSEGHAALAREASKLISTTFYDDDYDSALMDDLYEFFRY